MLGGGGGYKEVAKFKRERANLDEKEKSVRKKKEKRNLLKYKKFSFLHQTKIKRSNCLSNCHVPPKQTILCAVEVV